MVAGDSPALGPELSQYLRTILFYLSAQKAKPPPKQGLKNPRKSVTKPYFFAGSTFAYFRRKRSTRPAVSISFCLPVKKG